MREILRRCKRAGLALLALLIPGCSREPDLRWILDGRVEVPATERQALEALFADVSSAEVEVLLAGQEGGFGGLSVRVDGGRLVGLTVSGIASLEAANAFSELRRLVVYRSPTRSLAGLGPWPRLADLSLESTSLETFIGIGVCCPRLERLAVSHGSWQDLSPLADLTRLEHLSLAHGKLESLASAPPLPSLKQLLLTSMPVESLAGLDKLANLEKLQLFGIKSLNRLVELPPHSTLRELVLLQNGLTSLSGLPALPALQRLETSDNRLLSVQLADLPSLRELEMHEQDLLTVELGPLPSLEIVDLRGEGSLFQDGGRLQRLRLATQPRLEKFDVRRNHLRDLTGLSPQPSLRQIDLDRNPVADLESLQKGFPALQHVSLHRTRVRELPAALLSAGVRFSYDASEVEANVWEGVLRDSFVSMEASFVEHLPALDGRAHGHRVSCSLRSATFATPRLSCTGSLEKLTGLIHLPLIEVDPLSPGGGINHFPIHVILRVGKGRARLYVKYELDMRGLGEALASYRDREHPLIELGDTRNPDDVKKGYAFAEAWPGHPGTIFGEAHVLVDRLVVWIEGLDGAENIEYVIESPYR